MFEGQKTKRMDRWISLPTNNPVFSVQAGSKSFQKKFLLPLIKKKTRPAIVLLVYPVILFEHQQKSIGEHVRQMAQIGMFPKTGEDTRRGGNMMMRYMTSAVSKKVNRETKD